MAGYFFYVQFLFLGILPLLTVVAGQKECNQVGSKAKFSCKCQIKMNCAATPKYENAEPLRNLAPDNFDIRLTGPRWRKNPENALLYCQKTCAARVINFLRLEGADYTDVKVGDKVADVKFTQIGADILCDYAVQTGKLPNSIEPMHATTGSEKWCGFWYSYSAKACGLSGNGFTSMGNPIGCWRLSQDVLTADIGLSNGANGMFDDQATFVGNSIGVAAMGGSVTPMFLGTAGSAPCTP